jgi:hypothetical protein
MGMRIQREIDIHHKSTTNLPQIHRNSPGLQQLSKLGNSAVYSLQSTVSLLICSKYRLQYSPVLSSPVQVSTVQSVFSPEVPSPLRSFQNGDCCRQINISIRRCGPSIVPCRAHGSSLSCRLEAFPFSDLFLIYDARIQEHRTPERY